MQKIASYIISLMDGEHGLTLTFFSCVIFIFALINFLLAHRLIRASKHKQCQEIIISRKRLTIYIAWACFCIVIVWLPFDWARILSRVTTIINLLFPVAFPIFNIRRHYDPSILLFIGATFFSLITSNLGMVNQPWHKIFILLNILIFFLFVFIYIPVLIFNFIRNIKNEEKNDKKSTLFIFRISKIGVVASVVLSYIIIVYSKDFFGENLEQVFGFVAETIIIPIIFTLFLDIGNILELGNRPTK